MKAKDKKTARFQQRRTLRLTLEEDARIERQAESAGISVSEYMRRLFFGGRPIVARTDAAMIGELRRMGGLMKYLGQSKGPEAASKMGDILASIRQAIDRIGTKP
jgi:hypothetical protein